jgi:hypothetical protein
MDASRSVKSGARIALPADVRLRIRAHPGARLRASSSRHGPDPSGPHESGRRAPATAQSTERTIVESGIHGAYTGFESGHQSVASGSFRPDRGIPRDHHTPGSFATRGSWPRTARSMRSRLRRSHTYWRDVNADVSRRMPFSGRMWLRYGPLESPSWRVPAAQRALQREPPALEVQVKIVPANCTEKLTHPR